MKIKWEYSLGNSTCVLSTWNTALKCALTILEAGPAFLAHGKQSLQLLRSGGHTEAAATWLQAVFPWQCQGAKTLSLKHPYFQTCASSLDIVLSLYWLLCQPWRMARTTLWFLAWEVSELQSPSRFGDSWTSWHFWSTLSCANFHKHETTVLIKNITKNITDMFYLCCQLLILARHAFWFWEKLDLHIITDRGTNQSVLPLPFNTCHASS